MRDNISKQSLYRMGLFDLINIKNNSLQLSTDGLYQKTSQYFHCQCFYHRATKHVVTQSPCANRTPTTNHALRTHLRRSPSSTASKNCWATSLLVANYHRRLLSPRLQKPQNLYRVLRQLPGNTVKANRPCMYIPFIKGARVVTCRKLLDRLKPPIRQIFDGGVPANPVSTRVSENVCHRTVCGETVVPQ